VTELAMRQDRSVAHRDDDYAPALAETSELVLWAYEARQAAMVAESLAKTSFIPKSLQGRPADITAAILAGQELGLKPMATLRSMDIVQGTPCLRAHAMRGLVQSRGHEIQVVESTETRCVIRGRRKGEQEWQKSTWTIDRATKLGAVARNPEWKKQPQTMLLNRATGEISRMIASDVIYAMPYAAEEMDDDTFGGADPTPEIKPARRTAQRAPKAAIEPTPEQEPSFDEAPKPSQEQKNLMFALFGKVGPADRDDRLTFISELLDRTVTSSSDLTPAEVSIVIDDLKAQEVAKNLPADPTFDTDWPETAEAGA